MLIEGSVMRSQLIESVKVQINYAHYLKLQSIDFHDFTLVKKKVAQEFKITDEEHLETGITYLKRYYSIHVLDPLNPPAMTAPIDPFWHTHVLLSHDYTSFCDKVFGEYVHHIPLLFEDKIAVAFVTDFYNRTYKRHKEIFGDIDEKYFPKDAKLGLCCSPSEIGPNSRLNSIALFPAQRFLHIAPSSINGAKKTK